MVAELLEAHRRALARIARGDVLVIADAGVAPYAVMPVVPGSHDKGFMRVSAVTAPAMAELRSRGLVEWTVPGAYARELRVSEKGREVLAGG